MDTVATEPLAAAITSDEARRIARQILEQDRFQEPPFPRPLQGVIRRIADLLEGPGNVVRGWYESLVEMVPGREATVWIVLGAVVVVVAAVLSGRLARRRAGRDAIRAPGAGSVSIDPADLEAAARNAEAKGDLESSLRLRYRAGLLRLDAQGVIELTPSITNGTLTRIVPSSTFATLTRTFDEVIYGRRPVAEEDVAQARTGWERALDEARVR